MKLDLFPIEVYHFKVPDHNQIKEKYLPDIIKNYEEGGFDKHKTNDWHTHSIHTSFNDENQIIEKLPSSYSELFDAVMPVKWQGKFTLWHNVYKKFEYQEIHHHIPSDFSAIHFLSFDKTEHNPPVFFDPARLIKERLSYQKIRPPTTIHIDVEEGDMIIFPSYLEHLVPAASKEYKEYRVTVSINLTLTGIQNKSIMDI